MNGVGGLWCSLTVWRARLRSLFVKDAVRRRRQSVGALVDSSDARRERACPDGAGPKTRRYFRRFARQSTAALSVVFVFSSLHLRLLPPLHFVLLAVSIPPGDLVPLNPTPLTATYVR